MAMANCLLGRDSWSSLSLIQQPLVQQVKEEWRGEVKGCVIERQLKCVAEQNL